MTNWSFPVSAQAVGRLALLALFATAPLCATAQTALTEVVVTANRSAQLLTDALPHTTVIGRADIERSQAVDLPTLLSREAGFQFTQNGGLGTASNLFLRGSAGSQVLVLIDGVPLTKQDSTGTVSLEHIMLDQVERVEVVRGNVSAVYGSGAIGGVIQVFTRQGRGEPAGYAQLEVGTSGSGRIAVGVGGQFGDSRFSVGISRTVTDGISAMNVLQYPNENPDDDGYRNSSVHFGASHDVAPGHTFGLRAQGTDGEFDSDGGGFGSPTDIYQGSTRLGTLSFYSHNQFTQDWRSELTLSNGRESSVYDASRTLFPYESEAVTRTRTLNWNNVVNIGSWVATAGFERQLQSIDGSDSFGTQLSQERGVTALFAGLSGSMGDHSLQFNLRYDDADGISPETTVYAGYGLRLTPAWKLIASASTAFNLPPLGYLYDPFFGNPALQPETARSAELGLQWAQDSHVLRMTLFSTRISNLLQYDFNTFSFNNVSDSSNQGLELSYSGRVAGADLRASLTLQDPVDETTGDTLNRRARVMGAVSAFVPVGQWTWGADLRATGERPDTPTTPTLAGYAVVNLTARYAVTPGLDLTARVDNLFDRQYQTAYGYNQPGLGAYIGVLWKQK